LKPGFLGPDLLVDRISPRRIRRGLIEATPLRRGGGWHPYLRGEFAAASLKPAP